jgi:hypothetical protein
MFRIFVDPSCRHRGQFLDSVLQSSQNPSEEVRSVCKEHARSIPCNSEFCFQGTNDCGAMEGLDC